MTHSLQHSVKLLSASMFLIATSGLPAASVVNWTVRENAFAGGSTPASDLNTASPVVGDGTSNSADGSSIFGTYSAYTLSSVGDTLTLSGSVTLSGTVASPVAGQFRWALYDVNGSSDDTGWLGYFASSGSDIGQGKINERDPASTGSAWYMASGGGNDIANIAAPGTGNYANDGTYSFILTLERTAGGLQIDSSLIRDSDSVQFGSGSVEDTSVQTFTFNRAGFLMGGALDADRASFSNIDVTYTPIPEPSASILSLLGACALLLHRRRR
ncbi:MAG: PEP-CTERM sorting domain-containing protein [Akkermansiaceae bacterium]|nr:PEP-CTERM sorting domain-containing protein [Akkermansiaceae bacterium]